MKTTITVLSLCASFLSLGQTTNSTLEYNNASAHLNDGGIFFNQTAAGLAGYEIPKGSGKSVIFALSNWFGATNVNGQLSLSAQTYSANDDQFPGPLTVGTAEPLPAGQWMNPIVSVSRSEIIAHLQNYQNAGYVAPPGIANWPAHGDVSLLFDLYLAPFVDVNQDGIYNPSDGDFPCIKGDRATYIIMNDKGDIHQSGGDPLGIEIHYMFYQYASNDAIDNTTFCNMKIINRGTQTYTDFHTGIFMDADIGGYSDDYVGSSEAKNLMFAYNGDDFDSDQGGSLGYGANPPAVGVMSLNHPLKVVRSFSSVQSGTVGLGTTAADRWNVMTGNYLDGTPLTDLFAYSDLPSSGSGDSEIGLSNAPGDRRAFYSIELGYLQPGDEIETDYALIYNENTTGSTSSTADGLLTVADEVQAFYDNLSTECEAEDLVGIDELSEADVEVYPNPSEGTFFLQSSEATIGAKFSVSDISGRTIVAPQEIKSIIEEVSIQGAKGVYLLTISNGTSAFTKRLIIE